MVNVGKYTLHGCYGYVEILFPTYSVVLGIIRSHYKDPYKPISMIECHIKVLNIAHLNWATGCGPE